MIVEVAVPDEVRKKFLSDGEGEWLDALPSIVSDLARRWSLTIGAPLSGGTEALVVLATTSDGSDAVLKVGPASHRGQLLGEATVLALADGDGCARLLRHDEERAALLLERLGASMHALDVPIAERHDQLCDAAMRLWRPIDPSLGFPSGADKARWLMAFIPRLWEETGRPCSKRAVLAAVECAARREAAHDDDRAVLCHGDVHQLNALQAEDGSFKLIDPDGVRAEPEYDLGVIVRCDPGEDDLHRRTDRLADRTGCDRDAIWEWGVAHRLSSALYCRQIDFQPFGDLLLSDAERYNS
jgi:streptomycin 6-kinase